MEANRNAAPQNTETNKPFVRYHALDVLRGLCLILMVIHHALFDIDDLGLVALPWLESGWFKVIQTFFASWFVILAGSSCNFSRNNSKRAWILIIVALGISGFTKVFAPGLEIRFGIIHMLGLSTLLYSYFGKWLRKVPFPVWLVLWAATWQLPHIYTNIPGLWWLGIRTASFSSGDYYPMMPWFFMYMFGVWFGKMVQEGKMPQWFYELRNPTLEKISSKSLHIFIFHQPILIAVIGAVGKMLGLTE